MYTKEEREGILWEFHLSGMSCKAACESLPLFPTRRVLRDWLRDEEAARAASAAVRLSDVTAHLSIPKSTYLDQRARLSRPDPKAALRERVRAVKPNIDSLC